MRGDKDRARFWGRVSKASGPEGCWEWLAGKFTGGYGQFKINGKPRPAHRVSLELHLGRHITEGMYVLHNCDNRSCVNPAHLREGTPQDNMDDKMARGRHRSPKGSAHGNAKLTDDAVRFIRKCLVLGFTGTAMAEEFGVSKQTISKIKLGHLWSHGDQEVRP